jgi:cobalt/nickel transport system permease protein
MHIPDGYLSPATCAAAYAVVSPFWVTASRRVKRVVTSRNVPMLAMFAALSFLVMMFNVPIPDGTTAHAVGAVLIAIVLGPWAAVIAISVALLIQALLFGDGGVLAFGANALNMAVIMTFVGYGFYRLIAGRSPLTSRRRVVAAAIGGYAGINASALATAIELGIQPDLFHTAAGVPLYSPYHLSQSVPALMLAHLTFAGLAEAILTAGVLVYLQRTDVGRLATSHRKVPMTLGDAPPPLRRRVSPVKVALGFIGAMVLLTPLGLLAPGGAFGEATPQNLDLRTLGLQAVPAGLEKYNSFWSHTLLGGYGFQGGDHRTLAYLLSALVGIAVVGLAILALTALLARPRGRRAPDQEPADAP